jgi:hypothetical protein
MGAGASRVGEDRVTEESTEAWKLTVKIEEKAAQVLAPLASEMRISNWPCEFRAILWRAVADRATGYMRAARAGILLPAVLAGMVGVGAHAADIRVVRPLPGYACMLVRMPSENVRDFGQLPRVLQEPLATARAVGLASAVVFAKSPPNVVNGYAEVVLFNGVKGWLDRSLLSPYRSLGDPKATCTPSLMSNGSLGMG